MFYFFSCYNLIKRNCRIYLNYFLEECFGWGEFILGFFKGILGLDLKIVFILDWNGKVIYSIV